MADEPAHDQPINEIIPHHIIRVETALSRYPAHRLSRKGEVDINIVETSQRGEVKVRWAVSHNSKYGQPGPLAYKIDTLIINRRIEEFPRPVPRRIRLGSLSQLCEELGLADSGKNRSSIRASLRQNAFAGISARIRYRQGDGSERTLEAEFTRYSVIFTGETFPDDGRRADAVYIVLNDIFMQVINGATTRPLDYEYLRDLAPGPQRFYELLSFQMFAALRNGRSRARLVYSEFCAYAPQKRYFDSNRVHKQMARIHAPHRESGYIRAVEFRPTADAEGRPDWVLQYTPGPKARAEYRTFAERGGLAAPEVGPTREDPEYPALSELENELVSRGVTEKTARELVAAFPEDRVRRQIEYADFLRGKGRRKIAELGGYLAKAIRDDFQAPAGFETRAERAERERARAEGRRLEAEASRRRREAGQQARRHRALVDDHWRGLSPAEQEALDAEALASADPDVARSYREARDGRNPIAPSLFRLGIREPFLRSRLGLPPDDPDA